MPSRYLRLTRIQGVTVDKAITQAGVVAGLVGLGLGGAYEIYDAQESSRHVSNLLPFLFVIALEG